MWFDQDLINHIPRLALGFTEQKTRVNPGNRWWHLTSVPPEAIRQDTTLMTHPCVKWRSALLRPNCANTTAIPTYVSILPERGTTANVEPQPLLGLSCDDWAQKCGWRWRSQFCLQEIINFCMFLVWEYKVCLWGCCAGMAWRCAAGLNFPFRFDLQSRNVLNCDHKARLHINHMPVNHLDHNGCRSATFFI